MQKWREGLLMDLTVLLAMKLARCLFEEDCVYIKYIYIYLKVHTFSDSLSFLVSLSPRSPQDKTNTPILNFKKRN